MFIPSMRKIRNCIKCNAEFTDCTEVSGFIVRSSSRKTCYTCRPFKFTEKSVRECINCKRNLNSNVRQCSMFKGVCKLCSKKKLKEYLVERHGSKCCLCGYNKCISALEFHHKNPEEKEFTISRPKGSEKLEDYEKESDKCILVCSNCHREIHFYEKTPETI